jgi:selenocysteine-specific translation elongation factor
MKNKKQNELLDVLNNIDLTETAKVDDKKTEVTKEEMNRNIYEEQTISKQDFCDLDEEIAKLACEIEEESNKNSKDLKEEIFFKMKIKSFFEFAVKYIASSAAIFVMLLI